MHRYELSHESKISR